MGAISNSLHNGFFPYFFTPADDRIAAITVSHFFLSRSMVSFPFEITDLSVKFPGKRKSNQRCLLVFFRSDQPYDFSFGQLPALPVNCHHRLAWFWQRQQLIGHGERSLVFPETII